MTTTLYVPSRRSSQQLLARRILDDLLPRPQISEDDPEVRAATLHLRDFIRQAWHVIEPETIYQGNWHIDAACEHLEAARRREIRNLLITMPPRMMKSLTVSVFFPAWDLIQSPGDRFLYASYSQELATEHSVATRRVIESDWYQERWGHRVKIARGSNLKTRFETTKMGVRASTSVDGTATGKGADFLVVDDPHNVKDAESDVQRQAALDWWDKVMSSRFNDPMTGVRIIVMQRVHEQDLAGHVLEQGGYTHLNLPMEYEAKRDVWTGFGEPDPRTHEGELLSPKRIGPAEVADLKVRLGSSAYAGQYQQRPSPAVGGILKRTWWGYYDADFTPELVYTTQGVDTANKKGQENDYSAIMTMAAGADGNFYILDLWRGKLEFPALKRKVRSHYTLWMPDEVAVEDTAAGTGIIQSVADDELVAASSPNMPNLPPMPVVAWTPGTQDKVRRVNGIAPYVEAGRVMLPRGRAFVDAFVTEAADFPKAPHDDQVDALVICINRLLTRHTRHRPLGAATLQAFGIEVEDEGQEW